VTPPDGGASDAGEPDAAPGEPGDDPVGDSSVTWLLNDLKSVDSGDELFGAGIGLLEPAESEIARAVNSVELPEDVQAMAKLVPPPPRHLRAPGSNKPRHSASAARRREAEAGAARKTGADGEEWTRPDAPISVATDQARSFWRRPRNSWRLRAGVLAALLLVCAGLTAMSWHAIDSHSAPSRDQILSQPLPTTTSIAVPPSTTPPVKTVPRHHKPPAKPKHVPRRARRMARHVTHKTHPVKAKPRPKKPVTKRHKKPSHPVPTTNALLTAAVAQGAFASTWPAFAQGADAGSGSALAFVATPSAIKVALASHDCACAWWPVNPHAVRMTSPEEVAYPLSFAAEIDDTGGSNPHVILAILEQQSQTAPWMVAWVVSNSGAAPVLTSQSSFDVSRPAIAGASLVGPILDLAALFEAVRSSGYPPPTNFWTGFLTHGGEPAQTASQLIAAHATSVELHRGDVVSFNASNFSPVFGSLAGYFACGEIDSAMRETPEKGSYLVQPADHSAYGPTLAKGTYLSVTTSGVSDFCVDVSLTGTVAPAGLTGGVYSATGVSAATQHP
jgi:hypothetical protein